MPTKRESAKREAARPVQVEAVSLLGSGSLLAVVPEAALGRGGQGARGWIRAGETEQSLVGSHVALSRNGGGEPAALLLLRPEDPGDSLLPGGSLTIETADGLVDVEPDIETAAVSLDRFAESHLADLDAAGRRALFERALTAFRRELDGAPAKPQDLWTLRDALRPILPESTVDAAADYSVNVDGIWRVGQSSFYVKGWVFDRHVDLDHLRFVSPEGWHVDLLSTAFRHPRPDVADFFGVKRDDLGFIALIETPEASPLPSGWIVEAGRTNGFRVQQQAPPVVEDPQSVQRAILHDLTVERLPKQTLRVHHIRPALAQLSENLSEDVAVDTVDQYGTPPESPDVTIVVPLYKRMDFVEQQLAQFVHDPEIHEADLIYVLDSPEDAEHLRFLAEQLHPLYGVPFRVATLTANGGFSVVNNLGASLGRGRLLLLLNSDVLPAKPGWLGRLVSFYDAEPSVGALSPKLLYEDDSLQHAGMYFDRPPGGHIWSNEHYFKGLHRDFTPANVARPVPAVTGACLLIDIELYRDVGGLRGMYVRGDFEDSDLCLRLRDGGRESWYLPDVELYHLEGQSYPSDERALASEYNGWLHTYLWAETLAAT